MTGTAILFCPAGSDTIIKPRVRQIAVGLQQRITWVFVLTPGNGGCSQRTNQNFCYFSVERLISKTVTDAESFKI